MSFEVLPSSQAVSESAEALGDPEPSQAVSESADSLEDPQASQAVPEAVAEVTREAGRGPVNPDRNSPDIFSTTSFKQTYSGPPSKAGQVPWDDSSSTSSDSGAGLIMGPLPIPGPMPSASEKVEEWMLPKYVPVDLIKLKLGDAAELEKLKANQRFLHSQLRTKSPLSGVSRDVIFDLIFQVSPLADLTHASLPVLCRHASSLSNESLFASCSSGA